MMRRDSKQHWVVLTKPECTGSTAAGGYVCLMQAWKEQEWDPPAPQDQTPMAGAPSVGWASDYGVTLQQARACGQLIGVLFFIVNE